MEGLFNTALAMRWAHILTAIVVLGALIFYWLVLVPAARAALSEADAAKLREAIMKRWKPFVHGSILLFILSGLYNFTQVTAPMHDGQPQYHMLFGIKFLLAILVFVGIIVTSSTRAWSVKLRENGLVWSGLLIVGLAIVLIGGAMKQMPNAAPETPAPIESEAPATEE